MNETDKILNEKGKEIFSIFFTLNDLSHNWYSLKEASKIYSPDFPETARNQSTIAHYFYKFKKLGWLEEKNILKYFPRKTAKGKDSLYPDKKPRYRANYNFFFDSKINTELKDFLLFFLNQNFTRDYLIETRKKDIPKGVEDIIKQLFLISIALKKYGFKREYNINLKNYKKVIHKKIQEYYSDILYSKEKGKKFSKSLKGIYPKNSFWYFSELFAFAMIKLFFKEGFATEIAKTSPKLYFWLRDMYGDFTFVY